MTTKTEITLPPDGDSSLARCKNCATLKPLTMFSKDRKSKTGLRYVCKACAADAYNASRERMLKIKRDAWPEYKRKNAEKITAKNREYRRNHSGQIAAQKERYKREYPLKYKARTEAHNAITLGKLVKRPCEVCGNPETDAHHDDYLKPLSVRWLCRKHHAQWHAKNGPGLNGNLLLREVNNV